MLLLNIFEFIGTVAFAVSGTLIAIQKKLDLFGILTLAVVTAVGGGIFRDIIIGHNPPSAFKNPFYCVISILTALIIMTLYSSYLKYHYNKIQREMSNADCNEDLQKLELQKRIEFLHAKTALLKKVNTLFDAIGLGVFTATGANIAIHNNFSNLFLVLCMGSITGIGGGILRDVFVQDIPSVFKKEIYALASILGAFALWVCEKYFSVVIALHICAFVTFAFRMLSLRLNLNLPNVALDKYINKVKMKKI